MLLIGENTGGDCVDHDPESRTQTFSLGDLEWMVMPALLLEQYRIFRSSPSATTGQPTGTSAEQGQAAQATGGSGATSNMTGQPLGVALWAYLSPEAEEKLTVRCRTTAAR